MGEKVAAKLKAVFEDSVAFMVRFFFLLLLLFEGVILMDFEGVD